MADKPLKSITFPGLSDRYTIPQIDVNLSTPGMAADAKVTGDEIASLENAVSMIPEIDSTLSESGKAADAKTTGDEIAVLENAINAIQTITVQEIQDIVNS